MSVALAMAALDYKIPLYVTTNTVRANLLRADCRFATTHCLPTDFGQLVKAIAKNLMISLEILFKLLSTVSFLSNRKIALRSFRSTSVSNLSP
jgi:hypothetical protein